MSCPNCDQWEADWASLEEQLVAVEEQLKAVKEQLKESRNVARRCNVLATFALLMHRKEGQPLLMSEAERDAIWREHPFVCSEEEP
jgi:hypothetical protein